MARVPIVAVVGRANVGKSTLVNRAVGRRAAIEHPEPGVTRDRQGYRVTWNGVTFEMVDTGGWEPKAKGLAAKVLAQASLAAQTSDLILMVVDAEVGLTEDDLVVAKGLRKATVPVILVANKVDSGSQDPLVAGLERLGLGPAMPVSALHGRGSGDLLDLVVEHVRDVVAEEDGHDEALNIAVVGRPNVGKSSLFNRLVGEERSIVHDMPGTTRDTVDTRAEIDGRRYRFIDTAGMRRRAKDSQGPEYYGLVRSLRAIDESDVVIHVIDANEGATEQDQKIARRIADAGRAAVIVLNKWDLIEAEDADRVADDMYDELRFVSWAPLVRTSALTGRGINKIMPMVDGVRESWQRRISTATLNGWLREVIDRIPLGETTRGRPTRIKYLTQARVRPPTFVVFATGRVTDAARRGLENRLRERFAFEGTPIRFSIRAPKRRPAKTG